MDTQENVVTISVNDSLYLVCDFLKKNCILGEFVKESFNYHHLRGRLDSLATYRGKNFAKEVIKMNIIRYCASHTYTDPTLRGLFLSFSGSFEWCSTEKGQSYWDHFNEKWYRYIENKYGITSTKIKI